MTQLGAMTEITDHFEQAVAKLRQRFQDKPRFLALLNSYIKQVQEIEDCAWDIIRTRFLDETDELRTEILGKIVGQPRRGETLAQYKLYIATRIKVNRSLGRAKDILEIARALLIDQNPVYDEGGANFLIQALEELHADSDPEVLVEMLKQAKAAGVGFLFVYPLVASDSVFTLSPTSSIVSDGDLGFGSTTESIGGELTSAIDGRVTGYVG